MGQEAEYLFIGYRLPGSNTDDLKKAKVIAELLPMAVPACWILI